MWYSGDVDRLFGIFLYRYINKLQYPYAGYYIYYVEEQFDHYVHCWELTRSFSGIIMEWKLIFSWNMNSYGVILHTWKIVHSTNVRGAPVDWNETIVWVYAFGLGCSQSVTSYHTAQLSHIYPDSPRGAATKLLLSLKHDLSCLLSPPWISHGISYEWIIVIFLTSHPLEMNAARITHSCSSITNRNYCPP